MLMNYEKMNEIVASLPISFYTRTRYDIFVELDKTSENTYLEICEDHFNIHISYPVLSQYGADLTERQIRSLFYHEISHILDESKYIQIAGFDELTEEEKQSAYNIIADERIETIYKDYYTFVKIIYQPSINLQVLTKSTNAMTMLTKWRAIWM